MSNCIEKGSQLMKLLLLVVGWLEEEEGVGSMKLLWCFLEEPLLFFANNESKQSKLSLGQTECPLFWGCCAATPPTLRNCSILYFFARSPSSFLSFFSSPKLIRLEGSFFMTGLVLLLGNISSNATNLLLRGGAGGAFGVEVTT